MTTIHQVVKINLGFFSQKIGEPQPHIVAINRRRNIGFCCDISLSLVKVALIGLSHVLDDIKQTYIGQLVFECDAFLGVLSIETHDVFVAVIVVKGVTCLEFIDLNANAINRCELSDLKEISGFDYDQNRKEFLISTISGQLFSFSIRHIPSKHADTEHYECIFRKSVYLSSSIVQVTTMDAIGFSLILTRERDIYCIDTGLLEEIFRIPCDMFVVKPSKIWADKFGTDFLVHCLHEQVGRDVIECWVMPRVYRDISIGKFSRAVLPLDATLINACIETVRPKTNEQYICLLDNQDVLHLWVPCDSQKETFNLVGSIASDGNWELKSKSDYSLYPVKDADHGESFNLKGFELSTGILNFTNLLSGSVSLIVGRNSDLIINAIRSISQVPVVMDIVNQNRLPFDELAESSSLDLSGVFTSHLLDNYDSSIVPISRKRESRVQTAKTEKFDDSLDLLPNFLGDWPFALNQRAQDRLSDSENFAKQYKYGSALDKDDAIASRIESYRPKFDQNLDNNRTILKSSWFYPLTNGQTLSDHVEGSSDSLEISTYRNENVVQNFRLRSATLYTNAPILSLSYRSNEETTIQENYRFSRYGIKAAPLPLDLSIDQSVNLEIELSSYSHSTGGLAIVSTLKECFLYDTIDLNVIPLKIEFNIQPRVSITTLLLADIELEKPTKDHRESKKIEKGKQVLYVVADSEGNIHSAICVFDNHQWLVHTSSSYRCNMTSTVQTSNPVFAMLTTGCASASVWRLFLDIESSQISSTKGSALIIIGECDVLIVHPVFTRSCDNFRDQNLSSFFSYCELNWKLVGVFSLYSKALKSVSSVSMDPVCQTLLVGYNNGNLEQWYLPGLKYKPGNDLAINTCEHPVWIAKSHVSKISSLRVYTNSLVKQSSVVHLEELENKCYSYFTLASSMDTALANNAIKSYKAFVENIGMESSLVTSSADKSIVLWSFKVSHEENSEKHINTRTIALHPYPCRRFVFSSEPYAGVCFPYSDMLSNNFQATSWEINVILGSSVDTVVKGAHSFLFQPSWKYSISELSPLGKPYIVFLENYEGSEIDGIRDIMHAKSKILAKLLSAINAVTMPLILESEVVKALKICEVNNTFVDSMNKGNAIYSWDLLDQWSTRRDYNNSASNTHSSTLNNSTKSLLVKTVKSSAQKLQNTERTTTSALATVTRVDLNYPHEDAAYIDPKEKQHVIVHGIRMFLSSDDYEISKQIEKKLSNAGINDSNNVNLNLPVVTSNTVRALILESPKKKTEFVSFKPNTVSLDKDIFPNDKFRPIGSYDIKLDQVKQKTFGMSDSISVESPTEQQHEITTKDLPPISDVLLGNEVLDIDKLQKHKPTKSYLLMKAMKDHLRSRIKSRERKTNKPTYYVSQTNLSKSTTYETTNSGITISKQSTQKLFAIPDFQPSPSVSKANANKISSLDSFSNSFHGSDLKLSNDSHGDNLLFNYNFIKSDLKSIKSNMANLASTDITDEVSDVVTPAVPSLCKTESLSIDRKKSMYSSDIKPINSHTIPPLPSEPSSLIRNSSIKVLKVDDNDSITAIPTNYFDKNAKPIILERNTRAYVKVLRKGSGAFLSGNTMHNYVEKRALRPKNRGSKMSLTSFNEFESLKSDDINDDHDDLEIESKGSNGANGSNEEEVLSSRMTTNELVDKVMMYSKFIRKFGGGVITMCSVNICEDNFVEVSVTGSVKGTVFVLIQQSITSAPNELPIEFAPIPSKDIFETKHKHQIIKSFSDIPSIIDYKIVEIEAMADNKFKFAHLIPLTQYSIYAYLMIGGGHIKMSYENFLNSKTVITTKEEELNINWLDLTQEHRDIETRLAIVCPFIQEQYIRSKLQTVNDSIAQSDIFQNLSMLPTESDILYRQGDNSSNSESMRKYSDFMIWYLDVASLNEEKNMIDTDNDGSTRIIGSSHRKNLLFKEILFNLSDDRMMESYVESNVLSNEDADTLKSTARKLLRMKMISLSDLADEQPNELKKLSSTVSMSNVLVNDNLVLKEFVSSNLYKYFRSWYKGGEEFKKYANNIIMKRTRIKTSKERGQSAKLQSAGIADLATNSTMAYDKCETFEEFFSVRMEERFAFLSSRLSLFDEARRAIDVLIDGFKHAESHRLTERDIILRRSRLLPQDILSITQSTKLVEILLQKNISPEQGKHSKSSKQLVINSNQLGIGQYSSQYIGDLDPFQQIYPAQYIPRNVFYDIECLPNTNRHPLKPWNLCSIEEQALELMLAMSLDNIVELAAESGICVPDPEDAIVDKRDVNTAVTWNEFKSWYTGDEGICKVPGRGIPTLARVLFAEQWESQVVRKDTYIIDHMASQGWFDFENGNDDFEVDDASEITNATAEEKISLLYEGYVQRENGTALRITMLCRYLDFLLTTRQTSMMYHVCPPSHNRTTNSFLFPISGLLVPHFELPTKRINVFPSVSKQSYHIEEICEWEDDLGYDDDSVMIKCEEEGKSRRKYLDWLIMEPQRQAATRLDMIEEDERSWIYRKYVNSIDDVFDEHERRLIGDLTEEYDPKSVILNTLNADKTLEEQCGNNSDSSDDDDDDESNDDNSEADDQNGYISDVNFHHIMTIPRGLAQQSVIFEELPVDLNFNPAIQANSNSNDLLPNIYRYENGNGVDNDDEVDEMIRRQLETIEKARIQEEELQSKMRDERMQRTAEEEYKRRIAEQDRRLNEGAERRQLIRERFEEIKRQRIRKAEEAAAKIAEDARLKLVEEQEAATRREIELAELKRMQQLENERLCMAKEEEYSKAVWNGRKELLLMEHEDIQSQISEHWYCQLELRRQQKEREHALIYEEFVEFDFSNRPLKYRHIHSVLGQDSDAIINSSHRQLPPLSMSIVDEDIVSNKIRLLIDNDKAKIIRLQRDAALASFMALESQTRQSKTSKLPEKKYFSKSLDISKESKLNQKIDDKVKSVGISPTYKEFSTVGGYEMAEIDIEKERRALSNPTIKKLLDSADRTLQRLQIDRIAVKDYIDSTAVLGSNDFFRSSIPTLNPVTSERESPQMVHRGSSNKQNSVKPKRKIKQIANENVSKGEDVFGIKGMTMKMSKTRTKGEQKASDKVADDASFNDSLILNDSQILA